MLTRTGDANMPNILDYYVFWQVYCGDRPVVGIDVILDRPVKADHLQSAADNYIGTEHNHSD